MKCKNALLVLALAATMIAAARGGHELPIYPSFYPHEIEIRSIDSGQAAPALRDGKIQAYIGADLSFPGAMPEHLRAIETLGAFVLARINPASALLTGEGSDCAAIRSVAQNLSKQEGFILHPYPVTPLQGDYLHHFDLAAAARARFSEGDTLPIPPKARASGKLARNLADRAQDEANWDVEIIELDAAAQMASEGFSVNGWLGPPWGRAGWFHAYRMLADEIAEPAVRLRTETAFRRLKDGDVTGPAERINSERDLVKELAGGCRKMVVGYTLKRQYVNVEFSAGIENIGYDAFRGLESLMFIRTVKLKDFPWNGWLALGLDAKPLSAWNPVGGLTDPFGRLIAFTVGDPVLIPSPYDAGWMLNRIADVRSDPGR